MLSRCAISLVIKTELQTLPADTSNPVPVAVREGISVPSQDSSEDIVAVTATTVCKRLAAVFIVLVLLGIGIYARITVDLYDPAPDTNSTSTAKSLSDYTTPLLHLETDYDS